LQAWARPFAKPQNTCSAAPSASWPYPADSVDQAPEKARLAYKQAQIMSLGIDGFDREQMPQTHIVRTAVEDLAKGGRLKSWMPLDKGCSCTQANGTGLSVRSVKDL